MNLFRRRNFIAGIRVLTEVRCLEITRELYLGARPADLSKLIEEATEGAFADAGGWPDA